ncbi:MAG TPA: HAMP domain-containing protein [Candidatus Acidoferrales bacterium]|jgi:nitrogen fixation/metabolism regulation signal transduction histidine kinase|nr:HAMP domain-containing protein [Candidatus Acidoferrales bacterium]
MAWRIVEPVTAIWRASSMRRRIAYSLGIVRVILAPVIFLAIYYLLSMGWIVDRIVSVDAPTATLAQQASIQMLEARRAERNYLLLSDPAYLAANRESLERVSQIFSQIGDLQPAEEDAVHRATDQIQFYQQQFATAVTSTGQSRQATTQRIRTVLKDYEKDLDDLLRNARREPRTQLVDQLRAQVSSFDAEISEAAQTGNPVLREATVGLESSSGEIMRLASNIETRSWARVENDHKRARELIRRAEWVLTIVSMITIALSVWVSFVLPRQITKPLLKLTQAVDNAAEGNYQEDFDFQGEGEVVQLADSVRNLIARSRGKAAAPLKK